MSLAERSKELVSRIVDSCDPSSRLVRQPLRASTLLTRWHHHLQSSNSKVKNSVGTLFIRSGRDPSSPLAIFCCIILVNQHIKDSSPSIHPLSNACLRHLFWLDEERRRRQKREGEDDIMMHVIRETEREPHTYKSNAQSIVVLCCAVSLHYSLCIAASVLSAVPPYIKLLFPLPSNYSLWIYDLLVQRHQLKTVKATTTWTWARERAREVKESKNCKHLSRNNNDVHFFVTSCFLIC